MITSLDSRVMDLNAEDCGVGVEELMRNAGRVVADFIGENYPGKRVRIFCGRGNNGGDGLAAATFLCDAKVSMVDGDVMRSEAATAMADEVRERMVPFNGIEDDFDVLVDAGLGIGTSGSLRPQWRRFVEFCNDFEGPVVSVDVPTGFGTDEQVVPDVTITMVDIKEGMDDISCGDVVVADIGMPMEATLCTGPGDVLRYPVPKPGAHKGDSGRLLVIAGGPYLGAPALATRSAMRIGTDMVYAAVPSRCVNTVSITSPESVIVELSGDHLNPAHLEEILHLASRCDAVLIGPGLGTSPETIDTIRNIVTGVDKPMVIDADGITAVVDMKLRANIVVTPHAGEFRRLGGTGSEPADVIKLAKNIGCVVLMKGQTDVISDGEHVCLNSTGCPAMTSAGTGDVLSGAVAGLMARGMRPLDAAKVAAWLVGRAGESVFKEKSYGLCAMDVAEQLAPELGTALRCAGL